MFVKIKVKNSVMPRKRAIATLINDEPREEHASGRSTHKRRKSIYLCSKCNGKFVDSRTKEKHNQDSANSPSSELTMNYDTNINQEKNLNQSLTTNHHQLLRIKLVKIHKELKQKMNLDLNLSSYLEGLEILEDVYIIAKFRLLDPNFQIMKTQQ